MSATPIYSTIISVAQLQGFIPGSRPFSSKTAAQDLQIWDCSFDLMNPSAGRAAYEAQHIAGSRYIDLDHDLSDKSNAKDKASGGRHPLPAREKLAAWLGAIGVQSETQIVVYDRNGCNFCGRACWLGHARVAVLNGGLQAWLAAGGAVESGADAFKADVSQKKYVFTDIPGTKPHLFAIDSVVEAFRKGSHSIIDARAPARFRGEVEPLDPVAGHIPGALNRPFTSNFDAQGFFKSPAVLKQEFDAIAAQA
jgi:thiosulfate/3-mercaptopyruvate sulfurtransferase